jgi:hypothetical protein
MEDKFQDLLSSCSKIDFGAVNISSQQKKFCCELNDAIVSLCKSLPESTQTDAFLFFMRYLRTPIGPNFIFFKHYYVPAWSIIYWLVQFCSNDKELTEEDIKNANMAHAMAMFLHPFDDHLNDGQLPVTHLSLLLRSQAWMIMNAALNRLADGIDQGEKIIKGFIDNYYSSISGSKDILSLDGYCDRFRKQMATWLITPLLMTKKMTTDAKFGAAIQTAYGSFGIAWRLLDDIKDIQTDIINGDHSSIYICLPAKIKRYWNKDVEDKNTGHTKFILDYVLDNSVVDRIRERICSELESAASITEDYNLTGLAEEFRSLVSPLKIRQDH